MKASMPATPVKSWFSPKWTTSNVPPDTLTSFEPPGPSVVVTLTGARSIGGRVAEPGFTVPTYADPDPAKFVTAGVGSVANVARARIEQAATTDAAMRNRIRNPCTPHLRGRQ